MDVSCEIVNWNTLNERMRNERERHHIHLIVWIAEYSDLDSFLRLCSEKENDWQNETYSTLVNQALQVIDHEKRIRLYRQADKILVRDAPIFPVIYYRRHFLVKPWVRIFRRGRIGAPD